MYPGCPTASGGASRPGARLRRVGAIAGSRVASAGTSGGVLHRRDQAHALAWRCGRAQWGVVSLAQLRGLGLSQDAVQRRAHSGRLRRVHRGVYAVGGAVLPREGRWLAAVLASGQGAVLSHVSAAVHWHLLSYDAPRPEVTAPASRRRVPGIRLHRSRSLDAQDTTIHHGIPVTTVHRTLLDLAADAPDHHVERALAQAERLQLYDHTAIHRGDQARPMATKAPSA